MTLEKRLWYVRTLMKVQIGITVAFGVMAFFLSVAVGVSALRDHGVTNAWAPFIGIVILMIVGVFAIGVAFPWIVLNALKKRNEQWATAAMVSLIIQVVCGGGLLSLFPLITLILLLNKEASAYIGMK